MAGDFKLPDLPKIESILPPLPGMQAKAAGGAPQLPQLPVPPDMNNPSIKSAMSSPIKVLETGHDSAKDFLAGMLTNAQSSMSNFRPAGMQEPPFEQVKSMALLPFTVAEAFVKPLLSLPGMPGAKEQKPSEQPAAAGQQSSRPADYSQPTQERYEAPPAAQGYGIVSFPSSPVSVPQPIVERAVKGGVGFFTSGPKGTFQPS